MPNSFWNTSQKTYFFDTNLIHLCDYSVKNLSFKWSENYGFIFNWIHNESLSWLDETCTNAVYCGHCYNKTISETIFFKSCDISIAVYLIGFIHTCQCKFLPPLYTTSV